VPIPVAERSKARAFGRTFAGTVGLNPTGDVEVCLSVLSVLCCQVGVSVTGRSDVQTIPTDCDVSN
jgi:hypothetical protein